MYTLQNDTEIKFNIVQITYFPRQWGGQAYNREAGTTDDVAGRESKTEVWVG